MAVSVITTASLKAMFSTCILLIKSNFKFVKPLFQVSSQQKTEGLKCRITNTAAAVLTTDSKINKMQIKSGGTLKFEKPTPFMYTFSVDILYRDHHLTLLFFRIYHLNLLILGLILSPSLSFRSIAFLL